LFHPKSKETTDNLKHEFSGEADILTKIEILNPSIPKLASPFQSLKIPGKLYKSYPSNYFN
jgi:hypothetical protein